MSGTGEQGWIVWKGPGLGGAVVLYAGAALVGCGAQAAPPPPPPFEAGVFERQAVVDTFQGEEVVDPYRWLENVASPEVEAVIHAEDEATDRYVRDYEPFERLRTRLAQLMTQSGAYRLPAKAGGRIFYLAVTRGPNGAVANLFVVDAAGAEPRPLVGPGVLDLGMVLDYRPSPDGRHLAVASRIEGGSPWLEWRVIDVESGAVSPDLVEGAHFPTTDLSWAGDSRGFYYTRYSENGRGAPNAPQDHHSVRFHELGVDAGNDPTVFSPDPSIPWSLDLETSPDGRFLVIASRVGSEPNARIDLLDTQDQRGSVPFLTDADASYLFVGSRGDTLYFRTDRAAPQGRVVAIDRSHPEPTAWKEVVPESDELLMGNSIWGGQPRPLMANSRLLLPYQVDLRTRIDVFDLDGRRLRSFDTPAGGMVFSASGGSPISASPHDPEVFYRFIGITDPMAIVRLDVETGEESVYLRPEVSFDPTDYTSELVFYESADGTRVPMTLTYRRGLDRGTRHPTWLLVYGSGGFVMNPFFQGNFIAWLEMGGVHAIAHVRGGGAYGRSWQEAGNRRNKQTGVDDYAAAARWLVDEGYSAPGLIVANAVSAGGILTSALSLQYPDLIGAVVSDYPVTDLMRLDAIPGGVSWVPEYGSPADPDDYRALRGYSPYQNIGAERCAPPTLVLSSDADELAPHAYKFVAGLRAAQTCPNPVALQMAWGSPHSGYGSRQVSPVDVFAEQIAFVARVLHLNLEDWLGPGDP